MFKQKLYELKHQRAQAMESAKGLLAEKKMDEWKAKMDEVDAFNEEITAYEKMSGEHERFGADPSGKVGKAGVGTGEENPRAKAVKEFADAARKNFRVAKASGDTMNETVGSDGEYTVPQDIVNDIIHLRESKESLLDEVTVKLVKTKSGRRTFKKRSQHSGFTTVAEAAKYGRTATPQYATMEYEIEKRGGVLPVTEELLEDSDANIVLEVTTWLGDESRVTCNNEIMAVVKSKEAKDLVNLDGILAAWVGLGSMFRVTSKLITNDDGLLYLGTLKDSNGRYLLTPNPAEPQKLQLVIGPHTLPVKTYDNDTIASDGTKIPMILGDLKEGVVYWDRRQFSLKQSDVAVVGELNAFEQDLILWKGSQRDDCTMRDDEAFVYGYIDTATAQAVG